MKDNPTWKAMLSRAISNIKSNIHTLPTSILINKLTKTNCLKKNQPNRILKEYIKYMSKIYKGLYYILKKYPFLSI